MNFLGIQSLVLELVMCREEPLGFFFFSTLSLSFHTFLFRIVKVEKTEILFPFMFNYAASRDKVSLKQH